MTSIKRKIFRWTIFLVPLMIFLYWNHWFRTFEDRSFESMLIEKLIFNKEVKINEIIQKGERVCFFPSYATPNRAMSLSRTQIDFLYGIIHSPNNLGDHVWWIVVLSKDEVINAYRMSAGVRSNLKGGICVKQKDSKLIFSKKDRFTVYFDLLEEFRLR
ncbi:hypothetical protein [Verminephrobacter aporrectodeae]|uniref:hypothetical protein n=2 Tax=Verminephrobacter aporrectodeae TaxID=1110389 RepID=UPI0022385214|nr:hypothetical protein [Verminephrobacter aporrectodeae]